MKIKSFLILFSGVVFLSNATTVESTDIKSIGKTVKEICNRGSIDKGSSLKMIAKSNGGARIKFIGGLTGEVELSKEQWEGVQRVFKKDQLKDNVNYRDCVRELTPIFMKN